MLEFQFTPCCQEFAETFDKNAGTSPIAMVYAACGMESRQFNWDQHSKTWNIAGCCGGGCNVVDDMKFCPFCGTKLSEPTIVEERLT